MPINDNSYQQETATEMSTQIQNDIHCTHTLHSHITITAESKGEKNENRPTFAEVLGN